MGFVSGFTGGVTLTLGVAYLTAYTHARNRTSQAAYLRTQNQHLQNLLSPPSPTSPAAVDPAYTPQQPVSFVERAKERWNAEVEGGVRAIQTTDWDALRVRVEHQVASLWGSGLEKSRDGIEAVEERAKPQIQAAVDASRDAAAKGKDKAAAAVDRAAAKTVDGVAAGIDRAGGKAQELGNRAGVKAQEAADFAGAKAHEAADFAGIKTREAADATRDGVHQAEASARGFWNRGVEKAETVRADAASSTTGTIDAARGALRNVVSSAIEKGKEVVGLAQSAMGTVAEKASQVGNPALSAEDRALQARFESASIPDRSVEEVLAERYKPVAQQDRSVLRGV